MTDPVELLTAHALASVGLCANPKDAAKRVAFLNLCCPRGPADARALFGTANVPGNTNSSCGVVGVGIAEETLRALDLMALVPQLDDAMTLDWWGEFVRVAQLVGAYHTPADKTPIRVGCLYHVAIGRSLHWRTVTRLISAGSSGLYTTWQIQTVDGGSQDVAGYQQVVLAQVHLTEYFDDTSHKPIICWVDFGELVEGLRNAEKSGKLKRSLPRGVSDTDPAPPPAVPGVSDASPRGTGDAPPINATSLAAKTSPTLGLPNSLEGIDVSGHNGLVDWARVARAGVTFMFAKAGEGSSLRPPYEDRLCATHLAGAFGAGLDRGLYHYLRWEHGRADYLQQADDFSRVYEREQATSLAHRLLPPVLDVEPQGNDGDVAAELEAIGGWLTRVRTNTGRTPILYTYPGHWVGPLRTAVLWLADSFPLWIADYEPSRKSPLVPRPWTDWTLWQYAAGAGRIGRVDGCQGVVDRIVYRGTREQLRAL